MTMQKKLLILGATLLLTGSLAVAADNSGRIYGKIYTIDGDELEGLIRWDKNEGSWVDILNGSKEIDRGDWRSDRSSERRKYGERRNKVSFFGVTVSDDWNDSRWGRTAESGLRFGHIKRLVPIGDDEVRLVLQSGNEIEFEGGSTDIGTSIREIVVEDSRLGEIELTWSDIDYIEFMPAETREESNFGERLYGTLTTRRGDTFTGFVTWDVDEIFTRDQIDGEERGRDRKIRFDKIAAIERYSSKGAIIKFEAGGEEAVLRGTNDVDDSNRGILIADPAFGQIRLDWDEFDRIEFTAPPQQLSYDRFNGGKAIEGTVYTEDGESYSGRIRWDADEEYTWELLDGEFREIDFDIEFGLIRKIEKKSYRASLVTVSDGRTFQLRGSNDIDEDNKGIWVRLSDGDEVVIDWEDFSSVEFR